MIRLFCLALAVLASPRRSKLRLEAENAVLRHQLIVLGRRPRDGFFEWMGSREGRQCIEVRDVLWALLEDVQLDAKQRQLIWPDAERLDLEQSIQRIQKLYPDFPRDEVEEFVLKWIDMGYDPENYSQAQLDELDSLTERWGADHLRKAKASKKRKRTRHS